jgi:acyl carrier protein
MRDGAAAPEASGDRSAAAIERWLVAQIAKELEIDASSIDVNVKMSTLGLDSAIAVSLSADLGRHLGLKLSPTLVWDHPTIHGLAAHVAALGAAPR